MPSELGRDKVVVVGICAMAKKSHSRPMREIITRLEEFDSRIKVEDSIIIAVITNLKLLFSIADGHF